jgi:hypothetical protein
MIVRAEARIAVQVREMSDKLKLVRQSAATKALRTLIVAATQSRNQLLGASEITVKSECLSFLIPRLTGHNSAH